jgi:heme-degrading monooxygenase HmoA
MTTRSSGSKRLAPGHRRGRLYHVALESDGLIQVFGVWESEESFRAFGATLMPIMAELGADPGQPQISPVRNVIKG